MSNALIQPTRSRSFTDPIITAPSPYFLIWAIWLLGFATFNLPEREVPSSIGGLDALGLLKVGLRGTFLVVLGWTIVSYSRLKSTRQVIALYLPLCVFIGWAFFTTIWSPLKTVTFGQSMGQLVMLLISIQVALSCKNSAFESRILFQLSLALAAFSLVAIVLHFLFPDWARLDRDRQVLYHPTSVASAASIGLLLLLGCGLAFKYSWTRRLTKFAIPIHAFALLLASNRLSIVLDLSIVAILVVVYCHRALLAALTLAVCLAAITYLVLDPGLNAANRLVRLGGEYAIRGETHDSLSELSGRNEMWAAMWISYLESPVLGHGYFVSAAAGKLDVWEEYANHSAHNMVLQTLVSTGVIGLVLILWWKLYLLKFMFSSGVSSDSRYYAIFIPLATWYFGWSMLNAAFVGPFRPETIAFSVVVGILIHRVMTTRNQSDLESPVS